MRFQQGDVRGIKPPNDGAVIQFVDSPGCKTSSAAGVVELGCGRGVVKSSDQDGGSTGWRASACDVDFADRRCRDFVAYGASRLSAV